MDCYKSMFCQYWSAKQAQNAALSIFLSRLLFSYGFYESITLNFSEYFLRYGRFISAILFVQIWNCDFCFEFRLSLRFLKCLRKTRKPHLQELMTWHESYLHEPGVLQNLATRSELNKIYASKTTLVFSVYVFGWKSGTNYAHI